MPAASDRLSRLTSAKQVARPDGVERHRSQPCRQPFGLLTAELRQLGVDPAPGQNLHPCISVGVADQPDLTYPIHPDQMALVQLLDHLEEAGGSTVVSQP